MVIAILQARLSSSRFPGKVLSPLRGAPLLKLQWQRIIKSKKLQAALIATSTDSSDDLLAEFCKQENIPCYRGSLNDVLSRYIGALEFAQNHFSLNNLDLKKSRIVRLTGDCPLTDPEIIDQIIAKAEETDADYLSNTIPATFPDGLDVEVVRASILHEANQNAQLPSEREHVTLYVKNHPEKFRSLNFSANADFSSVRLTVDHQEDLQAIDAWLEAFPSPVNLSWKEMQAAFSQNHFPAAVAAKRNAGLEKSRDADPTQPLSLAIGTVQWGKAYGITNTIGQTSPAEITKILTAAKSQKHTVLDSAPDYGEAETRIGSLAPKSDFYLITKTHFLQKNLQNDRITKADVKAVREHFEQSLQNSRRADCLAVLVHYAHDLKTPGSELLWEEMERWCERGLTRKIGCSIYNREELDAIKRFPLQIIQAPLNILDQRLWTDGSLTQWKNRGTEIHIRSIFLQGILLQDPQLLPPHFAPVRESLLKLRKVWTEKKITPLGGCLHFLAQTKIADQLVVGVSQSQEWEEILAANSQLPAFPAIDYSPYACELESILHPGRWPPKNA